MANNPTVFPIDFDLLNDNEENVIFITDDPNGQNLSLEIKNSSAITTTTKNLTGKASANNHHFELVFRPGTLFNDPAGVQLDGADYEMFTNKGSDGKIKANADGTLSLYFKAKSIVTLPTGKNTIIKLLKVNAESGAGTRGTKVMLKYKNLLHTGNSNTFSGNKELHMNIVNHRGKKQIPLFVGFSGSNVVLNDNKHPNTLNFRITNTARKDTPIGAEPNSKMIISFDAGPASDEWTLATSTKLKGIQINATYPDGSTAELKTPTGSNEWILPFKTLAKGKAIDLTISKIITGHPTGHANIYVHYENIPSYWDGELISVIEKSPLVTRGDKVGIGTANPDASAKLQIINKNEGPGGGALIIGPTSQANLRLGYNTGYSWIQSHGNKPLVINNAGNNVGILSDSPKNPLDIGTYSNSRDTYLAIKTTGGNKYKAGIKLRHYNDNYGFDLISDETKNSFFIKQHFKNAAGKTAISVNANADVGIGTEAPQNKLDIGTYSNSKDTYLAIKTTGGNKYKAGIKLRHFNDNYGFDLISDETKNSFYIKQHFNNASGKTVLSIDGNANVGIGANLEISGNLILNNEKYILPKKNTYVRLGNSQSAFQDLYSRYTYFGTQYKPSDPSLKEKITPLNKVLNASEVIEKLRPVAFNWKDDASSKCSIIPNEGRKKEYGFLADQVAELVPDSVVKMEGTEILAVNYEALNTILFEAVRDHQKTISALKKESEKKQEEFDSLKSEMKAIRKFLETNSLNFSPTEKVQCENFQFLDINQ